MDFADGFHQQEGVCKLGLLPDFLLARVRQSSDSSSNLCCLSETQRPESYHLKLSLPALEILNGRPFPGKLFFVKQISVSGIG